MKKRAEKHLEIALGENMNIASLKPLALIEIMTDFAKKELEAINYTRCCAVENEQLRFLIDKFQTPKGNYIIELLMAEKERKDKKP